MDDWKMFVNINLDLEKKLNDIWEKFCKNNPEVSKSFMSSWEKYHNDRLDREIKGMFQDERHREAMFVARLKLEYKNVENITSLCKVTTL